MTNHDPLVHLRLKLMLKQGQKHGLNDNMKSSYVIKGKQWLY